MISKAAVLWFAALTVLLAALFVLSIWAGQAGYANLLMITANTFGTTGISRGELDELSGEEFLLTYSIRSAATAQADNSRHSAVLVETNQNYAGIMGYIALDGGFFTKNAMESNSRHIVLNETAALKMFGSSRVTGCTLKVNDETWIITGVIQDNDTKSLNLYAPAGIKGESVDSIMVLIDDTPTEEYVKNTLKSIGVYGDRYSYINLSKAAKAFSERFTVAWKAALSTIILFFITVSVGMLIDKFRFYRYKMRTLYFGELLAFYWKDLLKIMLGFITLAGGVTATLTLSLQILETCLTWQELKPITGELTIGGFAQKLVWLRDYQIISNILFWICICLIFTGVPLALLQRTRFYS